MSLSFFSRLLGLVFICISVVPVSATKGGGGGGEGNRVISPAPGRLNGRAQIISEQAAAADDCGFGPTSELVLTRTVDGDGDGDLRSHPAGR